MCDELRGVEIEFWVDWYDGYLSGIATHEGETYWFEAEPDFELDSHERKLFLYSLTPEEVARERELHRLFEVQAKGRPEEEWPQVLRERDLELPTPYATRERRGWFVDR